MSPNKTLRAYKNPYYAKYAGLSAGEQYAGMQKLQEQYAAAPSAALRDEIDTLSEMSPAAGSIIRLRENEQNHKRLEEVNAEIAELQATNVVGDTPADARRKGLSKGSNDAAIAALLTEQNALQTAINAYERSPQGKTDQSYAQFGQIDLQTVPEKVEQYSYEDLTAKWAETQNQWDAYLQGDLSLADFNAYLKTLENDPKLRKSIDGHNIAFEYAGKGDGQRFITQLSGAFVPQDIIAYASEKDENGVSVADRTADSYDPSNTWVNSDEWRDYADIADVMDSSEKELYSALLAADKQNGTNSAAEFLTGIAEDLPRRRQIAIQQGRAEYYKNAPLWESIPVGIVNSVFSIPATMIGGAIAAGGVAADLLTGNNIDPYGESYGILNYATGTREAIGGALADASKGWEVLGINVPSFLYNTGMSIADSAVGVATMGELYTIVAGSTAAAQTAKDLYDRGATNAQIFGGALASGLAEALFEKLPLDRLLKTMDEGGEYTLRQVVKTLLSQGATEAGEEVATELTNILSDCVIMAGQSEMALAIKTYMAEDGLSKEEAQKQAFTDALGRLLEAGVGGFLSGGVMGGGAATINYINNYRKTTALGQSLRESGKDASLYALAEQLNDRKLAAQEKKTSAKPTDRAVGRFAWDLDSYQNKQNRADLSAALRERGLSRGDAERVSAYLNDASRGAEFTAEQASEVENRRAVTDTYTELLGRSDSSVNRRNALFERARAGELAVSSDGNTRLANSGEEVAVRDVKVSDEGEKVELTVRAADGSTKTVPLSAMQFSSREEATLVGSIRTAGYDSGAAKLMLQGFRQGDDASVYAASFALSYNAGKYGKTLDSVELSPSFSADQRRVAYEAGKAAAQLAVEKQRATVAERKTSLSKGGVDTAPIDGMQLTEKQQAQIEALEQLGKALGIRFHLFDSRTGTAPNKNTAENGGVKMQLREDLGNQLNDWRNGGGVKNGSYNGRYFELGTTPDVFIKHGAPAAELIMYEDCVVKVTGGKGDAAHEISLSEISKLPEQLNDPILLFSGSIPNSFVALTELEDKNGHDVIVAVHINKQKGRTVVNKIASLYSKTSTSGKNRIEAYIGEQINNGKLLDASTKKAPKWFTSRGLQLPKLVQTIIDANNSISKKSANVNPDLKKSHTSGLYYVGTNDIWLDIHAGVSGSDTILFTAAHELTHYVADWSQHQFKRFADFLVKELSLNGQDIADMMDAKRAELAAAGETDLSDDAVYEEVICDCAETFLTSEHLEESLSRLAKQDKPLYTKVLSWLKKFFGKLKQALKFYEGRSAETDAGRIVAEMTDSMQQLVDLWSEALLDASQNAAAANAGTGTTAQSGEVKKQVNADFYDRFDAWDGKNPSVPFTLGNTSEALQSIGVKNQDFVLRSGTVLQKINKHEGITREIFRQIPELLERPIIVQFSDAIDPNTGKQKYESRITVLGELYAEMTVDGKKERKPVLVSVELLPTNRAKTQVLDISLITSAYGHSKLQQYLNENSILYVEPNKKRTDNWLSLNRLQLPVGENRYGSIRSITYDGEKVKIQNSTKMTEMQRALQAAGVVDSYGHSMTESADGDTRRSTRPDRSAREALAELLDSDSLSGKDRAILERYRQGLQAVEEAEATLAELNKQLHEMFTRKGPRDADYYREFERISAEAKSAAESVQLHDASLLKMQSLAPIRQVLQDLNKRAYKQAQQEGRELMKARREQEERQALTERVYRTTRQLRNKLLANTKSRNVKQELQEAVTSSLYMSDMLMQGEITPETIVRLGAKLANEQERPLVKRYAELLRIRENAAKRAVEGFADTTAIDRELERLEEKLSDLFSRERARLQLTDVPTVLSELKRNVQALLSSGESYVKENEYVKQTLNAIEVLSEDLIGVTRDGLTNDQLYKIADVLSMLQHTASQADRLFGDQKKQSVLDTAHAVAEEMDAAVPRGKDQQAEWLLTAEKMQWNNTTPVYAFERVGSETFRELYWGLMRGQNTYAQIKEDGTRFLQEQRKRYGYDTWDQKQTYDFPCADGKTIRLNLQQMMAVYALSRRDKALPHMREGGLVFDSKETFPRDKYGIIQMVHQEEYAYRVTEQTLDAIRKTLTDEQRAFVEATQAYLSDTLAKSGNRVSRELYGIDLFMEKVYFPMQTAAEYRSAVNDALQQTATPTSLKNTGMTKQTKPNAKNPLVLRGYEDVWAQHVETMSQYCGMVLPVENLQRVFNHSEYVNESDDLSIRAKMRGKFGEGAVQYFTDFVRDVNGGVISSPSRTGLAEKAFSNFKKTAVGLSASVVVQQPTAIVRAMAVIDPKYFAGARPITNKNEDGERPGDRAEELKTYSWMRKYAPGVTLVKEMGGFDVGGGRGGSEYITAREYAGAKAKAKGLLTDAQ